VSDVSQWALQAFKALARVRSVPPCRLLFKGRRPRGHPRTPKDATCTCATSRTQSLCLLGESGLVDRQSMFCHVAAPQPLLEYM